MLKQANSMKKEWASWAARPLFYKQIWFLYATNSQSIQDSTRQSNVVAVATDSQRNQRRRRARDQRGRREPVADRKKIVGQRHVAKTKTTKASFWFAEAVKTLPSFRDFRTPANDIDSGEKCTNSNDSKDMNLSTTKYQYPRGISCSFLLSACWNDWITSSPKRWIFSPLLQLYLYTKRPIPLQRTKNSIGQNNRTAMRRRPERPPKTKGVLISVVLRVICLSTWPKGARNASRY